jgi:hypothetical protein
MRLRTSGSSRGAARLSTAAAGFVAGAAVTFMLFSVHQKHRWSACPPACHAGVIFL